MSETEQTKEQLAAELGRAYRALRGLYGIISQGNQPDASWKAYHSLTLAAAMRYVAEDATDGTEYFIGKDVGELQRWLKRYNGEEIALPEIVGS